MTRPARSHLTTAGVLGLACFALLTQTGCATLFTATACVASGANHCDGAIEAAAAIDGAVLEATAHASANASTYDDGYDAASVDEASDDSCYERDEW